ncbi:MAG: glutamate-1-semialdehyde 2,1-aminomutase [Desulfobacteraceae bacterium]|nr:glutamate-1-semialdehyde 2,1-aminomutase [Desulfobacteraceae bacterium]
MDITKSQNLFKEAQHFIPGGVNSPARALKSVGGSPLFIAKGKGSKLYDVDANEYIDYVLSWGPLILGHQHPNVIKELEKTLKIGTSFGAPIELETKLASIVIKRVPSVEKVRMVNSGTEATMSAIRLARGFTKRDIVIKFDGCYHGHADTLLVEAGSGVATLNIPGSPGIPKEIISNTLSLKFNDIDGFRQVMKEKGDKIACVIVEPVAGNMGMVLPQQGFLETLREYTSKSGSLLIFDEVMTGFRVAHNCAQGFFNIDPDLTCFGKVIGGGLPVGAYGGKKEIMAHIAPEGGVYQAGTLSGNPLAMAAGIATLEELDKNGIYEDLTIKTEKLLTGLKSCADDAGINLTIAQAGAMAGVFFSDITINNFDDAKKCDLKMFSAYYHGMRERGIYLAPSQFEAIFMSTAHTDDDIEETITAAAETLADIK